MVSVSTCFSYNIPISQQLTMLKNNGFEYLSLSGNYNHSGLLDNTTNLINTIIESGLKVDTIHGCSASASKAFDILRRCSEVANKVGAGIVVVHPCEFFIREEEIDQNLMKLMQICERLIPIAEMYNVKFALENLHPNAATDVLKRALPMLSGQYFGMCYDITHAQIDGPRDCSLIEEFGDRIIAVHISDRIREFVDHVVPGEGFIDFNYLLKVLANIGYDKPLLLEVLPDFTSYKEPNQLLMAVMKAGLELVQKLENYGHYIR